MRKVEPLKVAGAPSVTVIERRQRMTCTIPEAGELIGLGRAAAYEAVRRGDIPSIRLGRRIVVPLAALERLLGAAVPQAATK